MTRIRAPEQTMFHSYPDVVSVEEVCNMLGGVSKKSVYRLLKNGEIPARKIGKSYRIPKQNVIVFLSLTPNND